MENNFKYAFYQLNLIYGIEMNEDEFEEIGLIAWNFIGNKRVRLYKCELDIDTETCVAKLPCNCDKIIAVAEKILKRKISSVASSVNDVNPNLFLMNDYANFIRHLNADMTVACENKTF